MIVPQLSATGVAGFQIKRQTVLRVVLGPVYASDIKQFLTDNLKADEQMRQVRFPLWERLVLNPVLCSGCKTCLSVCPHTVFGFENKKAKIIDKDGCMECGAWVLNCEDQAIRVTPGVGCAAYIISSRVRGKENASCC